MLSSDGTKSRTVASSFGPTTSAAASWVLHVVQMLMTTGASDAAERATSFGVEIESFIRRS
jgi:hypothetical protein